MPESVHLNEVFVSYNRGAEREQQEADIEPIVSRLQEVCRQHQPPIELALDSNRTAYRDSIGEHMQQLANGRCVVLVLSNGYFESEYCMQELLWVEENGDFRERVFPIVLKGTRLYGSKDQVELINYWEQRAAVLLQELEGKDYAKYKKLYKRQERYTRIADGAGKILAFLDDMNNQTEDWHRDSKFEVLLGQIETTLGKLGDPVGGGTPYSPWRNEVEQRVRELLQANTLATLKAALSNALREDQVANADDPAAALCAVEVKEAIGVYLHGATDDCLDAGAGSALWQQAVDLLGWLVLLGGEVPGLDAIRKKLRDRAIGAELQIPWRSRHGVEVATASLNGKPADLQHCDDHGGRYWVDADSLPDKGFGADANLNELKRALWVHLRLSNRSKAPRIFGDSENRRLRKALDRTIKQKKYRFLAVPMGNVPHPLKTAKAREKLVAELPGLWPLFLGIEGREPTLLLEQEQDLCDVIEQFLSLGEEIR